MSSSHDTRRFQFGLPSIFLVIALAGVAFAVLRSLGWGTITALAVPYVPVFCVLVLYKTTQALLARRERRAKAIAARACANAADEVESR